MSKSKRSSLDTKDVVQNKNKILSFNRFIYLSLITLLILLAIAVGLGTRKTAIINPGKIPTTNQEPSPITLHPVINTLSKSNNTASINVNGQQTQLSGSVNYNHSYSESNGANVNVSITDKQSSSGNATNQSSSSITVNTNN